MGNVSFSQMLSSASVELSERVIAEGSPLNYTEGLAQNREELSRERGRRRLERVAAVFDYEICHERYGYILRKKYTSPGDLPCVTFDELYSFYKDLFRLSRQYSPPFWEHVGIPPTMRGKHDFFRSLDKSEWERLKSPDGILVSQLRPASSGVLQKVLGASYVGAHYSYLDELLHTLDAARQSVMELKEGNVIVRRATAFNQSVLATLQKTKDDYPQVYEEESFIKGISDTANRLVVNPKCEYEKSLHEKPVVVSLGKATLEPREIGTLFSRLYDLRLDTNKSSYVVHQGKLPRSLSNLSQFRQALLAAIPSPLKRSLLATPSTSLRQKPTGIGAQSRTEARVARPDIGNPWRDDAVCDAAQMYLVNRFIARSKTARAKSVAFTDATPREKAALAIVLSRKYLEWFTGQLYQEPKYVSQFDGLKLTGKQYIGEKGRPMLALSVLRWDERGKRWRSTIAWWEIWDVMQR